MTDEDKGLRTASPTHVDNGDTSVPYMTREHASSITSKEGISCGGCFQAYRDGYARGRDSASDKPCERCAKLADRRRELETAIHEALQSAVADDIIGAGAFAILQAVVHDGIPAPPTSDNKGQAALRDAAQFLLDELADAEDDGNEKVASAADALRMALRPALSEALRSSDAERHAHAWKVGDLVTVHSLHPWPGVPAGSKAKVSSFKPDNVVGVVYEDHDVGELFTAAHNLRPRSAEARPCTPGTLCGALYVCPAHTKMGDQPFALAVRRVLSLDVEHCEGRYQRCIADLDAFRELFRDRERAEPDVTEFSYGFEVAREACIKWVEDNCGTANAHAMARAPVTLDPTPQRDMGKASLAHDAMMLLNATRAILGGRVPATGDIIVDAEYVRQLAINHQGALSRLVEATDAERATRIEEARAVLEGRPYEPWMGTEGVKP